MTRKQKDKPQRIVEIEEDLRDLKTKPTNTDTDKPTFKISNLTGLKKGKITDINPKGRAIYFTVNTSGSETVKFSLPKPRKYTPEETLPRLLEYYNKDEFGELLGEQITLIKSDNHGKDYEPFIPEKMDTISKISHKIEHISRKLGAKNFKNIRDDQDPILLLMLHYMIGICYTFLYGIIFSIGLHHVLPASVFLIIGALIFTLSPIINDSARNIYVETRQYLKDLREYQNKFS